ncbi:PGAP1-like protein [Candidatus Magnetomorum sp. HK-1]|nr:PGAP1-like protein [Candidatus Magnetomorum sp. HK-1]
MNKIKQIVQTKLFLLYLSSIMLLLTLIPFSFSYAFSSVEDITKLVKNIDDRDIDNEDRIPLILIHGIKGTSLLNFYSIDGSGTKEKEYFQNFINYFYEQNLHEKYQLYRFHYLSNYFSVKDIAQAFQEKIDEYIINNSIADSKFVIVAHSMGGLVARSYMEEHIHHEGIYSGLYCGNRVLRLITLATPHHGTPIANDEARANIYIDVDLVAVLNLFDVFYWWKTDEDCVASIFKLFKSINLLSAFDGIYNVSQNCQVQITDPNRSDLSWDNHDDLPQFQSEKNYWLDHLNKNSKFNSKVFVYYGRIDQKDPFYLHLLELSPW